MVENTDSSDSHIIFGNNNSLVTYDFVFYLKDIVQDIWQICGVIRQLLVAMHPECGSGMSLPRRQGILSVEAPPRRVL